MLTKSGIVTEEAVPVYCVRVMMPAFVEKLNWACPAGAASSSQAGQCC